MGGMDSHTLKILGFPPPVPVNRQKAVAWQIANPTSYEQHLANAREALERECLQRHSAYSEEVKEVQDQLKLCSCIVS